MLRLRCVVAIVLFSLCGNAVALRLQFVVRHGGETVTGAQVCMFPAPGLGGDDPIPKYFASNEIRCLPADEILTVPEGNWAYFATAGKYVSAGAIAGVSGDQRVSIDVVDSVPLDVSNVIPTLPKGAFLVLYFVRPATSLPVRSGETSVRIPARAPWLPVISNGTQIIGIGSLHKGGDTPEVLTADEFRKSSTRDVVTSIRWPKEGNRDSIRKNPPPRVRLRLPAGDELRPLVESGSTYSDGIIVFKDIPSNAGSVSIESGGDMWETRAVKVSMTGGNVVNAPPLDESPAGAVELALTIDSRLATAPATPSCGTSARDAEKNEIAITVSRCSDLTAGMTSGELANAGHCSTVASRDVIPADAVKPVTLGTLGPGLYRLGIKAPRLRPVYSVITVEAGRRLFVERQLTYVTVFGTVRRGADPVAAKIDFGVGETVSAAASGSYAAMLNEAPNQHVVTVTPCDGSDAFRFVPEQPIVAGSTFDIDIPRNAVHLSLHDSMSHQPVAGAKTLLRINFSVDGKAFPLSKGGPVSGADGVAVIPTVPARRSMTACASHEDYERACSQAFELDTSETKDIPLELRKLAKAAGRIVSPHSLDGALLFWSTAEGRVTEMDVVNADGTFKYDAPHTQAEHVVLTGPSHPLTVLPAALPDDSGVVQITVPGAAARTVTVSTSDTVDKDALLGVAVGDLVVPDAAFARHQAFRNTYPFVVDHGPAVIRDVLATGAVRVTHGPGADRLPPRQAALWAACERPEWRATCISMLVPVSGAVSFDH